MPVKALIMAKFTPEAYPQLEEGGTVNRKLHKIIDTNTLKDKLGLGVQLHDKPYLVTGDFDLIIDLEAPDLGAVGDLVLALRKIEVASPAIEETRTVIYLKPIPTFGSSKTVRSR